MLALTPMKIPSIADGFPLGKAVIATILGGELRYYPDLITQTMSAAIILRVKTVLALNI